VLLAAPLQTRAHGTPLNRVVSTISMCAKRTMGYKVLTTSAHSITVRAAGTSLDTARKEDRHHRDQTPRYELSLNFGH
jgi:hypothetical protein